MIEIRIFKVFYLIINFFLILIINNSFKFKIIYILKNRMETRGKTKKNKFQEDQRKQNRKEKNEKTLNVKRKKLMTLVK